MWRGERIKIMDFRLIKKDWGIREISYVEKARIHSKSIKRISKIWVYINIR